MRLQLALNVDDLDASIDFYTKMFNTEPLKVKPGYANFAIENPPLKLVLFQGAGENGSLNHLGVEVETADEVEAAERRISAEGLPTTGIDETECCYAAKTEAWVSGPDNKWEWYVKNADIESGASKIISSEQGNACCAGPAEAATDDGGKPEPAVSSSTPSQGGDCC